MDSYRKNEIKHRIYELMEGGDLSIILEEIKTKLAMDIANSEPGEVDVRNEKYQLIRGIKALEIHLRGYVNDIERLKENEDNG